MVAWRHKNLPPGNKHDHDMIIKIDRHLVRKGKGQEKGGVMQLRHVRGCCTVFWKPVQPLQRVPRLACSVASLSLYPGHQLLECYSLHCKTLTGYLLGKEPPSAYTATHNMQHCISAPKVTAEPHVECLRAVGLLIKTAACVDWQGMAPFCMDATPFARTQTLSARTQPPGPPPSSTTERVFSLTPCARTHVGPKPA